MKDGGSIIWTRHDLCRNKSLLTGMLLNAQLRKEHLVMLNNTHCHVLI